jgi:hypothetical protein
MDEVLDFLAVDDSKEVLGTIYHAIHHIYPSSAEEQVQLARIMQATGRCNGTDWQGLR